MTTLRFTYFDIKGGRGEVARLAMHMANIEFEDVRLTFEAFMAAKESFPYGAVPVLEVDGRAIAQSNGINRYLGKLAHLYPADALDAAFCDEIMDAIEDISHQVNPSMWLKDEAEKQRVREALAQGPIPYFLKRIGARLVAQNSEYFAGNQLSVADLKAFSWIHNLQSGLLDYIPTNIVATHAPELVAHHDRIWALPAVQAYYA